MKSLTGTRRLVRLALRRDRITLPLTLMLAWVMVAGSAPALTSTYPDTEAQLTYVASSAPSVVGRMFQGTVQDVSLGTILLAETYMTTAIILAIMSILLVTRHTRHNEEIGAGELIGSTVVGRNAPLSAALVVAVGANLLFAFLTFLSISTVEDLGTTGSMMLSLSLALVGIFFAGVAAITAQLSDYRRGANGMAIGALVFFFIVRALGDAIGDISADGLSVTASWISWLSPLGWGYQVLPYSVNRVLPIVMLLASFVLVAAAAYYLRSRRDLGSSIFQSKPGLARAKLNLLGVDGLTRRLQRGGLIGWGVGFVITGALMGVIVNDFKDTFTDSDVFQDFLGAPEATQDIISTIFAAMLPLMAAMLAGYVVSAISKLYDEESSGRVEHLMGTAVSRGRWITSHISFTSIGVALNLTLMGLVAATTYTVVAETSDTSFTDILIGSMVHIPAMLLFMSVIVLVYAMFGRFVKAFAWSYYGYIALIGSFAAIFSWPSWSTYLSPFVHSPEFPSKNPEAAPFIVMGLLSIGILVIAVNTLKRRDLALK